MRFTIIVLGIFALAHSSSVADAGVWQRDLALISRYRRSMMSLRNQHPSVRLSGFSEEERARLRQLRNRGVGDFEDRGGNIGFGSYVTPRKRDEIRTALEDFIDADNGVTTLSDPLIAAETTRIRSFEFRSMEWFMGEYPSIDTKDWHSKVARQTHLWKIEEMDPIEFDTLCRLFRLGSDTYMRLVAGFLKPNHLASIHAARLTSYFKAHVYSCDKMEAFIHL
jgi:hypothetical protein